MRQRLSAQMKKSSVKNDCAADAAMLPQPSSSIPAPIAHDLTERLMHCSTELQAVVNKLCVGSVYNMGISVTIADPRQDDCPLIACSAGFAELTQYTIQEIIGNNCRFLLAGVPAELIDDETRFKARSFCLASRKDQAISTEAAGDMPDCMKGGQMKGGALAHCDEILCVQANAKKSGELFRNMFHMKRVYVDGNPLIIGLQAGLSEDMAELEMSDLESRCVLGLNALQANMTSIEHVLASMFFYSSSMRRQQAEARAE